jgi:AcrR family transcriptional regulator
MLYTDRNKYIVHTSNGVIMVNTVQSDGIAERIYLGVKERQERAREAVGRAILDAARDLFVAEGYQNVSIRKIADRIEYSPAAIYSYFSSKDDIFFALAEEGFHLLIASAEETSPEPEGLDALRRAFWHLYRFSRTHPEYFALMFVDRSVPRLSQNWERFAFVGAMKERLSKMIQRAVEDGHFPQGTNPHAVFRILSAAVVGAAVLQLCNRLAPGEDPDALARDTLEAAITGLRTGFPMSFHPVSCEDGSVR